MNNKVDILTALSHSMVRYPDQRVCQIIFNALDVQGLARRADGSAADLFYITDDTLTDALNNYVSESYS